MPGHLDQPLAVSDDFEAEMYQPILHAVHGPLVARNGARGVDDGIARIENDVRMRPERDPAERGLGLALAARADQDHLVAWQEADMQIGRASCRARVCQSG